MEKIFNEFFNPVLIFLFTGFATFRYIQYCYMRDYEGISGTKKVTVDIYNTIGFLSEYIFLIYYGYLTGVWYYPVALFIISFIIKSTLYNLMAKDKKGKTIPFFGGLGFIALPVFAAGIIYKIYIMRAAIGLEASG